MYKDQILSCVLWAGDKRFAKHQAVQKEFIAIVRSVGLHPQEGAGGGGPGTLSTPLLLSGCTAVTVGPPLGPLKMQSPGPTLDAPAVDAVAPRTFSHSHGLGIARQLG